MKILILFFFQFQQKKKIGFYKLLFCFFYFNSVSHILTPIPCIPSQINVFPLLLPAFLS